MQVFTQSNLYKQEAVCYRFGTNMSNNRHFNTQRWGAYQCIVHCLFTFSVVLVVSGLLYLFLFGVGWVLFLF